MMWEGLKRREGRRGRERKKETGLVQKGKRERERDRERDRETERQKDRETERQTKTETDRETDREDGEFFFLFYP
jgi:RNA-binding protein 25